jgi:hypothetical protein
VASLGYVIPFAGSIVVFLWAIALQTIGGAALHDTTRGRALAAILIPVILCCTCAFLFLGAIIAVVAAVFAGVGN